MRATLRKQKKLRGIRFKAGNLKKLMPAEKRFWDRHMQPKSTDKVYADTDEGVDEFLADAIGEI